ncbi:Secondary metabolism regulator laeA like protein [Verticillium longisporum]|uniref:Secondary metabolism regulator laeA like protein n=1 Tax=Verticillium longisporum TaxID=100787 RepID=A0A8I3APW9_VERLO|nr:Secondary metabolism regulator laeA like protein [Verticillium longisporum]
MEETPDFLENGRRYASFLGRRYLLPIDSDEKNRLDFFHAIVRLARGGKLFGMHLPPHPRVLDLGTGTGIWAIDVSDQLWEGSHEHAIVDGLDLSPIQPREVYTREVSADVMSLAPLTRIERQATGDILKLVRRMKEESCRLSIHGYCKL